MLIDFTFLGCKISLNFYFLALVAFVLVSDKSCLALWGIIAACIHEIGHVASMSLYGERLRQLNFGFVNIDIVKKNYFLYDFKKELVVLCAGCLANFIIALIFYTLYMIFQKPVFLTFSYQNLFVGVLNILPINSLDGGQILKLVLSRKLDVFWTEKISLTVSFVFLIPLLILGFSILLNSKYNFSLLILACFLISYILKEDIF